MENDKVIIHVTESISLERSGHIQRIMVYCNGLSKTLCIEEIVLIEEGDLYYVNTDFKSVSINGRIVKISEWYCNHLYKWAQRKIGKI